MTDTKQITTIEKDLKTLVQSKYVQERFHEVLGRKAQSFTTSLLSIVSNNDLLSKAEPKSILNAAMTAATLDLPINQNLGFAYIIPYNDRKSGQVVAQFQMGYKGFVQLAMRSGQFATLNVSEVKEGEIKTQDRLTGEITFDWKEGDRDKLPTIGYVAYMRLINGFSKSFYQTTEQLKAHGLRYSQTMKKGYGLWTEDFDAMASKTVIKLLLSKYAPLTTQMQTAQLADQAIIKDDGEMEYVDNKPVLAEDVANEKERTRIKKHIEEAKTMEELQKAHEYLDGDEELIELFDKKASNFVENTANGDQKPEAKEKKK